MQIIQLMPVIKPAAESGAICSNDFPAPAGSTDFQTIMSQMTDREATAELSATKTQSFLKMIPLSMIDADLQPETSPETGLAPGVSVPAPLAPGPDPETEKAQAADGPAPSKLQDDADRPALELVQALVADIMKQLGTEADESLSLAERASNESQVSGASTGNAPRSVPVPSLGQPTRTVSPEGVAGTAAAASASVKYPVAMTPDLKGASKAGSLGQAAVAETIPVASENAEQTQRLPLPQVSAANPGLDKVPAEFAGNRTAAESSIVSRPYAQQDDSQAAASATKFTPGTGLAGNRPLQFSSPLASSSLSAQNVVLLEVGAASQGYGTINEGTIDQSMAEETAAPFGASTVPNETSRASVVLAQADLEAEPPFAAAYLDAAPGLAITRAVRSHAGPDGNLSVSSPAESVLSETPQANARFSPENAPVDQAALSAAIQDRSVLMESGDPAAIVTPRTSGHAGQAEASAAPPSGSTSDSAASNDTEPAGGCARPPSAGGVKAGETSESVPTQTQPPQPGSSTETSPAGHFAPRTARSGHTPVMDIDVAQPSVSTAPETATEAQVTIDESRRAPVKGGTIEMRPDGPAKSGDLEPAEMAGGANGTDAARQVSRAKDASKAADIPEPSESKTPPAMEARGGVSEKPAAEQGRPLKPSVAEAKEMMHDAAAGPAATADIKSAALPKAATSSGPRPPEFIYQLAERIQAQLQSGQAELRIHLKPEHLGNLEIKAESGVDGIIARIAADSNNVKHLLESSIQILQQSLQEQGLKVDRIDVVLQQGFDTRHAGNHQHQSGHTGSGNDGSEAGSSSPRPGSPLAQAEIEVDPSTAMILGPHSTFHKVA